tara:strand:+ start:6445 stop:7125 length:681 start_codon:yes stop_codon:yes gene_type:complete
MKYQQAKFLSLLSVFLIIFLSFFVIQQGQAAVSQENALYQSLSAKSDLNPKVLNLALKAHKKAKTKGITRSNLITVIDYSLPSTQKRLWVFDLEKKKMVYHTHVAHGSGSGVNYAKTFSNHPNSYQSSVGLFLTGTTYQGKHGRSLNLHGLEKGINSNAYQRRIVIHSAKYVGEHFIKSQGRLGRSHGCPALSPKMAVPIINKIKGGVLLFSYYPEPYWLGHSSFL